MIGRLEDEAQFGVGFRPRIEIEDDANGTPLLVRVEAGADDLARPGLDRGAHLSRLLRVGEEVADEFDDEAPPFADLAGARTHHRRQGRARGRRPAPELAVGERDRRALGEARLGPPLRDDVVVVFRIGRDLEQNHLAFAPVADRLDPQRRAKFPMGVVVVEVVEDARALKKAEAARHHNLGVVLSRLGQWLEAREQWEQAVRIDPNYADAHVNLGIALAQVGDMEGAVGHLTRALQIKPDNVEALNDLGNVMMGLGRVQEAVSCYEQALRLKPDSVQAHNNMGIALTRLSRVAEAITHWKRAVEIDPYYADAHYNLGVALEQTGKPGEAIEQYKQTLRIKPDYVEAQKKLAQLQSVR